MKLIRSEYIILKSIKSPKSNKKHFLIYLPDSGELFVGSETDNGYVEEQNKEKIGRCLLRYLGKPDTCQYKLDILFSSSEMMMKRRTTTYKVETSLEKKEGFKFHSIGGWDVYVKITTEKSIENDDAVSFHHSNKIFGFELLDTFIAEKIYSNEYGKSYTDVKVTSILLEVGDNKGLGLTSKIERIIVNSDLEEFEKSLIFPQYTNYNGSTTFIRK